MSASPHDPLAPGSWFGDYQILDLLGVGGMGNVYRAREKMLDRVVALKTLSPELGNEPSFVERFLKEARAVARLNHPNIVQVFAFGAVQEVYYLAMELLDGSSLGHYLKANGRWSEYEAITIVRYICRALAVAHAQGLVHRDIKPDNVILTHAGEVKLVDLGIAKQMGEEHSLTQTGTAIGTPNYIAPEQILGQRDIDGRADIYSLGATLYHLVTGRVPFQGSSGPHVMSMHLVEPFPDPRNFEPSISEGFCLVLRKMMARDRDERYTDVTSLDADLYRLQTGAAPEAQEPAATLVSSEFQLPGSGGGQASRPGTAAEGERTSITPATFDPKILRRIEEHLSVQIGPMAKVLVRRMASASPTLTALCDELAKQVSPGPGRENFRAQCMAAGGAVSTAFQPAPSTPSGGGTNAQGPLQDDVLARVEGELARRIGPLARVLVRRNRHARSLEDLVALLEVNISDEKDRATFRRALLGA
ncbi:MAG: serine/threonine-protein kinase [Thermoanaerobaculia bacterium]